ncbi:MAG: FAD-dependent oxidoreductase, partial [Gammaproteobacteria bacterium]
MQYDFFVIGGGSGGVRAARTAAKLGAKVAVAEAGPLGGTCVNVGCVPKKLLVYASHYRELLADAAGFGWTIDNARFDWPTLIQNKNTEISRLNGVYANMLDQAGVTLYPEHAQVSGANTVTLASGKSIDSKHILIATGGQPTKPDIPGTEHGIVSDQAFFLEQLPRRIIIAGGGYIGVEFAGIFHGL